MPSDKKQVVLIVIPAVALGIALIITAIVIMLKLRRRSKRNLLPTTQKPQESFVQYHLSELREWQKPAPLKTDPNHIPFLAEPAPTLQPQRPVKGSWQQFKEKQQQRAQAPRLPLEKWHLEPKGAAYWREVGKEMQARKSWWKKFLDRLRS
jgi:hypothetical protein